MKSGDRMIGTEPILTIKDLEVAFKRKKRNVPVIQGLNLKLYPGKVLGLVGESGCGKSMTALSILRLLPSGCRITGGEILLEKENLLAMPRGKMHRIRGRRIGMIFQDPGTALNPVRTIGGQYVETLQAHLSLDRHEARRTAENMLGLLGLASPERLMRCYPFQLSGGMRQRVVIALAMSLRPDILLADEPTTALDVTVQAQILEEMKKLQNQYHTCILMISHNMGVVAQTCEEVAVMYAGTIVETGSTEAIFKRPAHPYTQGLLYAIPHLNMKKQERLAIIKGQPPEAENIIPGCPFSPRCALTAEICVRCRPPLQELEDRHGVACHFPSVSAQNGMYREGIS